MACPESPLGDTWYKDACRAWDSAGLCSAAPRLWASPDTCATSTKAMSRCWRLASRRLWTSCATTFGAARSEPVSRQSRRAKRRWAITGRLRLHTKGNPKEIYGASEETDSRSSRLAQEGHPVLRHHHAAEGPYRTA